ncbi:5774_t:CDS:2, partial [Racocetra persica]
MSNLIPLECLQLILDNLKDDLYNTSSAANRCLSVKCHSQATSLLDAYISCLIQLNKVTLVEKGIVSLSIRPPMFNYVQFLKCLDLYELYMAIYDYKDYKLNGKKSRFPLSPKFNSVPRKRLPLKLDGTHLVTSDDCRLVLNFFFRENLGSLNHNDEYRWM